VRQIRDTLTPREQMQMEHDKEIMRLQMEHQTNIAAMQLEVEKIETSFGVWLKIPILILSLPIKALLIIPLSIYAIRGKEVPDRLWNLL